MKPLRVLIVDDEPLALRRLELLLGTIDGAELCGRAAGCAEAAERTATLRPDVVLLDIRMRDGSGFDYLSRIDMDPRLQVIFVTAFDSHAIEAFGHHAVDYLLKPVDRTRLEAALARARLLIDQHERADRAEELQAVVANLRERMREGDPPAYDREIWIRKKVTGFIRVPTDEIDWISSEDDYVRIHAGDKCYLLRSTLGDMLERLDPARFARIHRSTIVRREIVTEFCREGASFRAILADGRRLPVGRGYAKEIRRDLARFERQPA